MGVRLRIQTKPPLPQLKAWFKPDTADEDSITDLKVDLCNRVEALAGVQPASIDLLLDDFELLDDSPVDLIRDGDLICIRRRPLVANTGNLKRKLDSVPETTWMPHKKRKQTPAPVPISQLDSSDDSSDDSSSDSSDSDSSDSSTSSSDSDSDSDSSSDSSSPPTPQVTKRPLALKALTPAARPAAKPKVHVPPGHGKPTTHSRNVRRRLKRQHTHEEVASITVTAPKGSSAANLQPLGVKPLATSDGDIAQTNTQPSAPGSSHSFGHINGDTPGVMMAALRTKNKNKKRGFRNALTAAVPSKIVFGDDTPDTNDTVIDAGEVVAAIDISSGAAFQFPPRLVPPSELQERGQLPGNMFVTSVDVEENQPSSGKAANKKANKKKNASQPKEEPAEAVDEPMILDYGEKVESNAPRDWTNDVDYTYAESVWEELTQLSDIAQIQTNTFIACRTLDINPATFTPEFLMSIARVAAVSEDKITLRRLSRPGATADAISFGQRKRKQEDYEDYAMEDEATEMEEPEDEVVDWKDILSEEWRVLV